MNPQMAAERLEALCSRAEHCRYELSAKLRGWMVPFEAGERILDDLEARRFFSDARFAEIFARHKVLYGKWGRRKIAAGLRAKRISADNIAEALDAIDENEYRLVMIEALCSKAKSVKEGNTFDGRTKVYRFGVSKGYEPALVAAAIRSGVLWDDSPADGD